VIFHERIATVQELQHPKQAIFAALLDLISIHDERMFHAYLPEETEFDDCQLTTYRKFSLKEVLKEMRKVFDYSKQ